MKTGSSWRKEKAGVAQFSYRNEQGQYDPIGAPFKASMGRWVGEKMGLFSRDEPGAHADVDYFRVSGLE